MPAVGADFRAVERRRRQADLPSDARVFEQKRGGGFAPHFFQRRQFGGWPLGQEGIAMALAPKQLPSLLKQLQRLPPASGLVGQAQGPRLFKQAAGERVLGLFLLGFRASQSVMSSFVLVYQTEIVHQ